MIKTKYDSYSPTVCGGPHGDDIGEIVAAYFELSKPLAVYGQYKKNAIRAIKPTAAVNLCLSFIVNPADVTALDAKSNGKKNATGKQIGLLNNYDPGMCAYINSNVLCTDPNAEYGSFTYCLE